MIKSIIIEDEAKSRTILSTLIERYCTGIEIAGLASSIGKGEQLIKELNPDLVFLDVALPDGNGFDMLSHISNPAFETIFTTAYNGYALQAIKASALDYLLKPVNITELRQATEKATERINSKKAQLHMNKLLEQYEKKPSGKIAIPSHDGLIFIAPADIISLVAAGSYTHIFLSGNKKITSTRHLKEYEEQLPASDFIRVHHSHIINLSHVRHYHRGDGGFVTMTDNSEVIISKRKKKDFLNRFIG